jgi:hypothetical protein
MIPFAESSCAIGLDRITLVYNNAVVKSWSWRQPVACRCISRLGPLGRLELLDSKVEEILLTA